jgi:hypothetical protein
MSDLEAFIPKAQEHPTRVSHRRNPIPRELATHLKAAQLRRRELRPNSLLDSDDVHTMLPEIAFKLASPPWLAKTPHIVDESPHV